MCEIQNTTNQWKSHLVHLAFIFAEEPNLYSALANLETIPLITNPLHCPTLFKFHSLKRRVLYLDLRLLKTLVGIILALVIFLAYICYCLVYIFLLTSKYTRPSDVV